MPAVVLLIVVVAVVLFLAKSVYDAQQLREGQGSPRVERLERRTPRTPRPRRARVVIDEQKLADHVAKLRKAVKAGLVTREEAAASIIRQADGQLSEEAALQLLNAKDAA
jgi:hypothetical protein